MIPAAHTLRYSVLMALNLTAVPTSRKFHHRSTALSQAPEGFVRHQILSKVLDAKPMTQREGGFLGRHVEYS